MNTSLQARLNLPDTKSVDRVSQLVDLVLEDAVSRSASDVHFEPTNTNVEVRFRIDGVLHSIAALPAELAPNVIARLKVLAELLTYRIDIPQEGRLAAAAAKYGVDMRVSTFPTIHGEKAAVRIFEETNKTFDLDQLGLPEDILRDLTARLEERTGAILLTGPSGSGKTTTIYACLRHLVRASKGGRHVVTIEDPVEQVIEGVSQSQVRPGTEFDFARGLRSLLRQDPEVIMIGEIRDPDTAAIAVEAALTGHLVFSTLHAGSACGVVSRLLEMGVEPYLLTSGLKSILNQRLVRKVCDACRGQGCEQRARRGSPDPAAATTEGLLESGRPSVGPVGGVGRPAPSAGSVGGVGRPAPSEGKGCEGCSGTGYHGRTLLAELLTLTAPLRQAILARSDTITLEAAAACEGRTTIWTAADAAVHEKKTTSQEIARVLGPRP